MSTQQIITNQFQKELKQHGNEHFPFLVSYQKLSEYESGSFMWHWHPEIEITYVQKGSMCYKANNLTYHPKEGAIIFTNSNALHSGSMENQKDCSYIPVTFDPKLLYGFHQSTIHTKYVDPVVQNPLLPAVYLDQSKSWHQKFREHLLQIIMLDQEKPEFYELDIVIHLQMLWRLLLAHISCESVTSLKRSLEYERIRKILSYIENNYQNPISLKDIAAYIHLCESECTRLFKRNMNTTLFTFLQEYRIERSLEYLSTPMRIGDVAREVGFEDSNYYSKVFTKIKGCSPREYKKRS